MSEEKQRPQIFSTPEAAELAYLHPEWSAEECEIKGATIAYHHTKHSEKPSNAIARLLLGIIALPIFGILMLLSWLRKSKSK
jgi:hypothetical protein